MNYRIIFYTFEYSGVNSALDKSGPMSRYACKKWLRENDFSYDRKQQKWKNNLGSFASIVEC